METILLLRPDKAGDAIKSLSVLRALRDVAKDKEFHLLASEHNASVFALEPGFTLHVLPRNWKKMKREKLLQSLSSRYPLPERFDKIVSLLTDPFEEVEMLLSLIPAEGKYSVGPVPGAAPQELHKILVLPQATPAGRDESLNISLLVNQALQLDISPQRFSRAPLFSESDEMEALEKMGPKNGKWLGFCPFSGAGNRTHPLRKWERFVQKVTQEQAFDTYFLFGVPSDYAKLEKLRMISPVRDKIELCFPSTFRTLGAYLKRLDGVVAVDSGPLHLAQSLGVKSLGILSGGDVERWFNRLNPGDHVLRRGIFNRFPTVFEMVWAYDKWKPALTA